MIELDINNEDDYIMIADMSSRVDDDILSNLLKITKSDMLDILSNNKELNDMIKSCRAYAKYKVADKCYTLAIDKGCRASIKVILETQAGWNTNDDFNLDSNLKLDINIID